MPNLPAGRHRFPYVTGRISTLSDLHKFSGISDFSKGDNPFFDTYYALYRARHTHAVHPAAAQLQETERRAIEQDVRQRHTAEEIRQAIEKVPPQEREALVARHDPHGFWQRRQEIFAEFAASQHVVLNGDIFDIECCKDPQGKIEAVPSFVEKMETLERSTNGGFRFHEHVFQQGKTVFLHGDETMSGRYRPRKMYPKDETQGGLMRMVNQRGERLGMKYVERVYAPPDKVAANVASALATLPAELVQKPEEVENIFVGHTHVPFLDNRKGGKWVTNTGSATNWGRYGGVTFEMAEDGAITPPRLLNLAVGMGAVRTPGY